MLIQVMSNRIASYLDEKFLLREPTEKFLHDTFTRGSNDEKDWDDTFSVWRL